MHADDPDRHEPWEWLDDVYVMLLQLNQALLPWCTCRLSAPNFMVSTSTGKLLAVNADSFNTPDPDNPSGSQRLIEAPDSCLTHALSHPLRPELLLLADPGISRHGCLSSTGSSSDSSNTKGNADQGKQQAQGQQAVQPQRLLRWDLVSRSCLVTRQLRPEQHVVQLTLARDGSFVALGCTAGHVVVLKGDSLQETVALRGTKHDISRCDVWGVSGLTHTCKAGIRHQLGNAEHCLD